MLPRVIIITGPTASGKTDFSEYLAQHINGTIINADMGQFYTPLTVGTAKPDWKNKPFTCLLFDILDQPIELNIVKYREKVLSAIKAIVAEGKVPIIVGGSLFYIKSLFYPPQSQISGSIHIIDIDQALPTESLWNTLKSIDEDRAQQIHPHDRYRIVRALKIWQQTGIKPSQQQPVFTPAFRALIVCIEPPRDVLRKRIVLRTEAMLQCGLIDESRILVNTDWEVFLDKKGLIGYREIFKWIHAGSQPSQLETTKTMIDQKTWQYAKRQLTFLSKLKEELVRDDLRVPHVAQILTLSAAQITPEIDYSIRIFLQDQNI